MKATACFALLSAILTPGQLAQTQASSSSTQAPYEIQISAGVAEKLLIHKVEIRYPPRAGSRVSGTVILAIEIDKNGNVLHPAVVSGPLMLQKSALDVVRKYKYKPYLLKGRAVDVETTVSIFFGLQ
jgi:TonB family protein